MSAKPKRIVILGGGFGGVCAAQHLDKIFAGDENIEITLISENNYLLFTPMLPEVPSSSIEAKHIITPIRAFFRRARFQNSHVHSIDLENRRIRTSHCEQCHHIQLTFDHLVLAVGSTTKFFGLPGVTENALPMKTLSDAMALRNHIIDILEHADMQTDPQTRKKMLTFVIAGGGFAGVETAAEIRDFLDIACRYYPNLRHDEISVVLVHAGARIMPEINAELAGYALEKLRQRKVEVVLNTKVRSATSASVTLSNDEEIATKTLIWTAGVATSPLVAHLPCARNKRGQVKVNEHLQVPDAPNVWALGDCAEIINPKTEEPYPPTAQHAIRQGKVVAENITASIRGGDKKPFVYDPLGMLVSLGRRSAVAEILGFKFSGFFAWWLWRTIYLFKLPGLERKVRVALDWTLDLFFTRDIVLLKVFMRKPASEVDGDIAQNDKGKAEKESKWVSKQ